jgi:transcriptional regulator with XRE-family HTH domain
MTNLEPITATQVRAARALLDWSQERLAEAAGIGLSTVRDFEKERRGAGTSAVQALRRCLEGAQVVFLPSEGLFGPGVRLRTTLPTVLQRPRKAAKWDALIVAVDWRGQELEVYLSREALDRLGEGQPPVGDLAVLFDLNRTAILKAAALALEGGRLGPDRRVALTADDFTGAAP